MLRRLYHEQPASFAFTAANLDWANGIIAKYPEGRQASAVIPLLWRAQEQEGWVTKPAIEEIARMLGMASIRVLEVATFYFMFQLQPVGAVAHIQVCGTTTCMICGSEDLMRVCKAKIAPHPHELSADGKFSWEEVECLGACANAPMAQIGKDFYEDLTPEIFAGLLDALARGEVPRPGPQDGRFASEPMAGLTSLSGTQRDLDVNASVAIAEALGDTVARITGEHPTPREALAGGRKRPRIDTVQTSDVAVIEARQPQGLSAPIGEPDDLKLIKGVGPVLEQLLHRLGYYHFAQIAAWTPEEVAWVDDNLEDFRGRVSREGWVEQARALIEGDGTAHAQDKVRRQGLREDDNE